MSFSLFTKHSRRTYCCCIVTVLLVIVLVGCTDNSKRPSEPLSVIITTPENASTGVEISAAITATFNRELDTKTISNQSFIISDGKKNLVGIVVYGQNTVGFSPLSPLKPSTTYKVLIKKSVNDVYGISLGSDYLWEFKTKGSEFDPNRTDC